LPKPTVFSLIWLDVYPFPPFGPPPKWELRLRQPFPPRGNPGRLFLSTGASVRRAQGRTWHTEPVVARATGVGVRTHPCRRQFVSGSNPGHLTSSRSSRATWGSAMFYCSIRLENGRSYR